MNYSIIKDEEKLRSFIRWLPDLQPMERYYLCLFARNKYCKELTHIKSDKAQLKRFVSDKERMFQKIKQLEIELGWYMQKEIPVPEAALALYITPNPREMYKAGIHTMVKIANCIRDQNNLMNVHQEALSEIQKCKSRNCFIDFDIDFPEDAGDLDIHTNHVIDEVKDYVNSEAVTFLRTRGGLHCLVDPGKLAKQYKNTFYQNMSKLADQTGDTMMPVPGCTQGMFTPYFINI